MLIVHRCKILLVSFFIVMLLPLQASAQKFPKAQDWVPLRCGEAVMTDLHDDQTGASAERDIVGSFDAPAGYYYADQTYLYFRLGIDSDPYNGNKLRDFSWGVELGRSGNFSNYELLLIVNGAAQKVELYENTATATTDSPADPADKPPLASYGISSHLRVDAATGSNFGGDTDYFISFAAPWSDLQHQDLLPTSNFLFWAGTSSVTNALNADLACHNGADGAPQLSHIETRETVVTGAFMDSDSDGYSDAAEQSAGTDPNDPSSHPTGDSSGGVSGLEIQGGGGCSLANDQWFALPLCLLPLGILLLVRRYSGGSLNS